MGRRLRGRIWCWWWGIREPSDTPTPTRAGKTDDLDDLSDHPALKVFNGGMVRDEQAVNASPPEQVYIDGDLLNSIADLANDRGLPVSIVVQDILSAALFSAAAQAIQDTCFLKTEVKN